ncbi:MAG: HD domain-containing protein [Armatimonadetes bacterium]|nr:HD domain-containing protein [Armatimonadota bacterium]
MLIIVVLVAGFSLGATLMAAERVVTNHSLLQSVDDLEAAKRAFDNLVVHRAEFAARQARLIAELPVFRASMDLRDVPTASAMAEEYRQKLQADFCVATDTNGHWLGRPGWPRGVDPPPALVSDIERALTGQPHWGTLAFDDQLFLVVCEPARFAEEVLGTFTAGYRVDDTMARELARVTHCQVSFAVGSHLCGSSLPPARQGELQDVMVTRPILLGQPGQPPSLRQLGDARYVGGIYALFPRTQSPASGTLILLRAWQPTQWFLDEVKTALLWVGMIALTITLGVGLLASRRITRPLRDIATVATAVAAGNWECQAQVRGTVEAMEMARAFNQMTANVRHWYQEAQSHAQQLAEALEDLRESYTATLQALSRALDTRDNETEGHSLRVTHYALRLAQQMAVDNEASSVLKLGALLHDIGKIGVPDAILHKPGRLTAHEKRIMQRHCEFGLEIVGGIPYLERAADVIRCHHEHFDGSGYPNGLAGEAIPLIARIFAVADALDAITSDRPYCRARSFAEALIEIRRCAGTQFDPRVVSALVVIIDDLRQWRNGIETHGGLPAHCVA